jgi:hypothetical protein
MKRVLLVLGLLFLVLILIALVAGLILHKPRPEVNPSPEADALARKMMAAVHAEAWDSTRWLRWTFLGQHDYVWDKERHLVEVRWSDYRVLLDPNTTTGKAWKKGEALAGEALQKTLDKALAFFFNDSFWLNPVVKVFDPGTRRGLLPLKDGSQGLIVEYTSGGVTPGDAYLWILDDNHRPKAWRMWVSVLPVGGLENTWEGWMQLPTGAWIAPVHRTAIGTMELSNIRGGMTLEAIGLSEDPFADL